MMKPFAVFSLLVFLTSGCSGKTSKKTDKAAETRNGSDHWTFTGFMKKEQAIVAIKKLRGRITVDEKSPGKPVVQVLLVGTHVTDAGIVHLKGLPKLQRLRLSFTKVSDAGLACLKGLTDLEMLVLFHTKIGDAGLVHLKGLTKLKTLDLNSTKVSDAGMVYLKGMTELQFLVFSETKVSDAGLVHLKGLTKLRELYLRDTYVTAAGVRKLQAELPKCRITR